MSNARSCDMSGGAGSVPAMEKQLALNAPGNYTASTIVFRWELIEWLKAQPADRTFRLLDKCRCVVHTFFTETGKDWHGTVEAKVTRTRIPDGSGYMTSKNMQWLYDFIMSMDIRGAALEQYDITAARALALLLEVPI